MLRNPTLYCPPRKKLAGRTHEETPGTTMGPRHRAIDGNKVKRRLRLPPPIAPENSENNQRMLRVARL